jgi:hypothetical protein
MPSLAPITSRLAARAPRLAARVRRSAWKARNGARMRGFRAAESAHDAELLAELVELGVAVRGFDEVFADRRALADLTAVAERREAVRNAGSKDFLERLMPDAVTFDSAYVRLALEPRVIALANAYIGMRSYLRGVELWRNVPTDEPPKLSQLWHRDWDDEINLKYFVYLSDVTARHGPFTFAPRTHPRGRHRLDIRERLSDDEMAERVPRRDWVMCTGDPGTVVIADTCGHHKGGKPEVGDRLLWTAQFTTGAALAKRSFRLEGAPPNALTVDQRYALFEKPRR